MAAPIESRAILASAARTTSTTSEDQLNQGLTGLIIVIDVTAVTGTPSNVYNVQFKDQVSGKYYPVLSSAAIVATGTTVLQIHPALVVAANLTASALVPEKFRVQVAHGTADSITYSVSYTLTP